MNDPMNDNHDDVVVATAAASIVSIKLTSSLSPLKKNKRRSNATIAVPIPIIQCETSLNIAKHGQTAGNLGGNGEFLKV